MTTYRKKPVLVDAWQYAPNGATTREELDAAYDALVAQMTEVYEEELGYGDQRVIGHSDETGEALIFGVDADGEISKVIDPRWWVVRESELLYRLASPEWFELQYEPVPTARPNFIQSI